MEPNKLNQHDPGPPRRSDAGRDHYRMLVHLHEMILDEHRYDEEDPCELARKLAAVRTELHDRHAGARAR